MNSGGPTKPIPILLLKKKDVSQSKVGGGSDFAPLHNFLSFNLNLMKLSAIDHWSMPYLLIVMHCS